MLKNYKRPAIQIIACIVMLCSCIITRAQNFIPLNDWLKNNVSKMGGRAVLMIYRNGRIIYSQSVNDMKLRQKIVTNMIARRMGKDANTETYNDTIRQPIASCSKWLSAALIMTFVDDEKLKLTDSVGKFLPVLSRYGKGAITISQCLSHTTGIKAPPLKESLNEIKTITSMDDAIKMIAEMDMEGEPGKVFHYSSVGLQIAGAIIEKISGKSFETLFTEKIAKPLDMKNTDFGNGKVAMPAGGAGSTPRDYMNFLVMILGKGIFNGKRILSEASIAAMQVNRISEDIKIAYSPAEAGDAGYGYGEWILKKSATGNFSAAVTSPGLFGSFPWVENEKQYCAFLMTYYINSKGRNDRYNELKGLVDAIIQ